MKRRRRRRGMEVENTKAIEIDLGIGIFCDCPLNYTIYIIYLVRLNHILANGEVIEETLPKV